MQLLILYEIPRTVVEINKLCKTPKIQILNSNYLLDQTVFLFLET